MALIPPSFLDCVVAIGSLDPATQRTSWLGTGFLVGHLTGEAAEGRRYRTFLVTNRHVLEGQASIQLRFNQKGQEPARQYQVDLAGGLGRIWFVHPDPDVDVAVVTISGQVLDEHGVRWAFFRSDQHALTRAQAKRAGVTEGDPVYVLGFPMGLVGEKHNHVIVRLGCLARVRDALDGETSRFLVDAFVFPGNSGGPVVSRPELVAVRGTEPMQAARLLGIVGAYIPYQDVAVSQQTRQPRVVFAENSGLAAAIPYDFIAETMQEHFRAGAVSTIPDTPVSESCAPVEPMGPSEIAGEPDEPRDSDNTTSRDFVESGIEAW